MRIARLCVALALVGASACSKSSSTPAHAGSSGGTKPVATAEVHIPLLNRDPVDGESIPPRPIFVVYRSKSFYRIDTTDLIVSPDGRPRVSSDEAKESGHWIEQATQPLPNGTPTTPAELAAVADERGVVIFADGTTPVAEVVPAMEAAFGPAKKCWWLGVKPGALSLDACGPAPVDPDEAVVLSLTIVGGKGSLSLSHVGETTPFASLAELDSKLREQKASAFFADRTDLAIASTDARTLADLVTLFAQVHSTGFTSAYLAH